MNISTGISLIDLSRAGENSPVYGKNYIWPKYQDSKVEKITGKLPENQEPLYYKPAPAEREKLAALMSGSEMEYNSYGKADSRRPFIQPGSFFDALA